MKGRDTPAPPVSQPLTRREQEVLSHMAEGLTNQEIAERMVVALSTVKWYARQIFNKLTVDSREEAVARAQMLGLLLDAPDEPLLAHNLPAQISSFVGRNREIAEIRQLLQQSRFVTLTGPGGTGKTRLALEVAVRAAGDYPDGVALVHLAAARSHELVPGTIAGALGVIEQPNQPLTLGLQQFLARKKFLLVLDNYEHLLPSAPLINDLLQTAPQLTILITSREALNLTGEYEYLVPPLSLPDPEEIDSQSESVTLFVQRARMASRTFSKTDKNTAAISGICLRLDGLPLAIELAAARIKLLGPQQMLERLDNRLGLLVGGPRDMPDRQQTLRSTIDWSYDLLDEEEQKLFARLAVFNGGRTIDAVEVVCRSAGKLQPLDGLELLLNKNLLFQDDGPNREPRFYMLETIHEYALERLCESGEQQLIQDRHTDYYLQLCEEMSPGYLREGQLDLFRKTDAELDNIRTAFGWAMKNGQIESAARMITAINYYLRYSSPGVVEGYRLTQRVLPAYDEISTPYKVTFLISLSELAFQNDDIERSKGWGFQALKLARELDDKRLLSLALSQVVNYSEEGDVYKRSIRHGLEALELCRERSDKPGTAYALIRLGEIYRLGGELGRARQAYEESLAICLETGEVIREQMLKANLSLVAYSEGEYEQAKATQLSALRQREFLGWKFWMLNGLSVLAGPLARLGEPEKAATLLSASANLLSELGLVIHPNDQPMVEQYVVDTKAQLDEQSFSKAWAAGQRMTYQQAVDYALGEYL